MHRSTYHYRPKGVSDKRRLLELEVVNLSRQYPTMGYKKITGELRKAGFAVGKQFVQRVRREEGLQVPA
ncbi:IS3 family transposase, partial [Cerasicoccus arenae]|uniref:IS3 family transposase n=1 Tax=Cerasicoccus arenae TaxID=424488 RepID=UPI0019083841